MPIHAIQIGIITANKLNVKAQLTLAFFQVGLQ